MSYDIYGNSLRRGHCEVHPHVHEEYPCSVCIQENNSRNAHKQSESDHYKIMELEHVLKLSQQRIAELEQTLRDLGYCTDCSSILEHHLDEPFSSCNCGTTEDYATRPLQKAQLVQQHNNELAAMVERLRGEVSTTIEITKDNIVYSEIVTTKE